MNVTLIKAIFSKSRAKTGLRFQSKLNDSGIRLDWLKKAYTSTNCDLKITAFALFISLPVSSSSTVTLKLIFNVISRFYVSFINVFITKQSSSHDFSCNLRLTTFIVIYSIYNINKTSYLIVLVSWLVLYSFLNCVSGSTNNIDFKAFN